MELRLPPPQAKAGWVCPRCSRVWAPYVPGCQNCNSKVLDGEKAARKSVSDALTSLDGEMGLSGAGGC